jgi:hypothetical protein
VPRLRRADELRGGEPAGGDMTLSRRLKGLVNNPRHWNIKQQIEVVKVELATLLGTKPV